MGDDQVDTQQLLRELEQLRARVALLEQVDAILMADEHGRLLDANPAAEKLLGYEHAELQTMRVIDIIAGDPEWTAAEWTRFIQEGLWFGEVDARCKDGTVVPVEARASRVELPDETIYVSVLRDVSERHAIDRIQREFIALVTHELKAPLTSLKGFAQLLQRRKAYDDRAVEIILDRTNHLERLITDLLDVARIGSGRLVLRRSHVDLIPLAQRCAEQARLLTTRHAFHVETSSEELVGWWDADRVAQVLQNLLSNAIKYAPDGGDVIIRVEDRGDDALVSVTDQGIGIPSEATSHLFTRFYRVESVETASAQGLGLGLFISRTIVEAHGGRIWAESRPGSGSTFAFTLPCNPRP